VYPHKQAIQQLKVSSCRDSIEEPSTECTATMLTVNYKIFYDLKLSIDFKATNMDGFVGIIFRKKDAFNYYSLDIGKEFIRFRKMVKGKQHIFSHSKIDGVLSDKWYNVELSAKQNLFQAKFGIEKDNVATKYNNLPVVLRGEDLYLKSGSVGLLTENCSGSMFDSFRVTPEDCFNDDFDEDKVRKFKVHTNRFHETYATDIEQVWSQHKNDNKPWEYKNNMFNEKTIFWKQVDEEEKFPPAFLINKNFDTGTVSFRLLFQKNESMLDLHLLWSSMKDNVQISITPFKIKITNHDNGQPISLYNGKIAVNLFAWTQFYIGATETNILCQYFDHEEEKLVNCYEREIPKPAVSTDHKIGFRCREGECSVDDLRVDLLAMEAIAKEVAAAESDDDEEDDEEEEEEELHKNLDNPEGHHASDSEAGGAEHSGGGGSSPAHKDSNGGGSAGGGAASPAHLVENDDEIDYQMCLSAETPKQREGYCNEMFGGETAIVKECSKNFCTFCCESKFPQNMRAESNICIDECDDAEKPDHTDAFNTCSDPFDPNHAVAKYCSDEYDEKDQKWRVAYCQRDMCQMCCITTSLQFGIKVLSD